MRSKLYLMVGNIGSGKTTIAKEIQKSERFLMYISDDEICTMLNGDYSDVYWTSAHKQLYATMLIRMIDSILASGFSVILDSGLHCISRDVRKPFIDTALQNNAEVIVYDVSHPKELERRLSQDRSSGGTDWPRVHTLFKTLYDKPSEDEGINSIVVISGD